MKFNIIKTKESFKIELMNLKLKEELEVNVKGRLLSIVRYHNGFTIWWGTNFGIDCDDELDIIDKLEMLTSFIVEKEVNECYLTKEELAMVESNK